MTVKTKDLLAIFNISAMTLTNWEREGMPKQGRGKFDLAAVVQWRIAKIEERFNNKTESLDIKTDEARLTKAKADMLELDLKEKIGELVNAEAVSDEWYNIASNVKTKLLAIPAKLALRLVGKTNINEITQILKDAIHEVLKELQTKFSTEK